MNYFRWPLILSSDPLLPMSSDTKMVFLLVMMILLSLPFVCCHAGGSHVRHRSHRTRRSSSQQQRVLRTIEHASAAVVSWPVKRAAEIPGDIVIGGLHMVHEREDLNICGPIMPQGGLQAAEVMLYTVDKVNELGVMPKGVTLGTHILDDCDKDTYGLQQAVDFIKGRNI